MEKIANYKIEGVIGSGGMGTVYRAVDRYGRQIALKEILEEFVNDPEYRRRIDREVGILMKLHDPNVVHVYKSFELDGRLYIKMDLIEGVTIEQYIEQNGVFDVLTASEIMQQLLGTMQYVHSKGIIHRDLKPGNVMIRPNGQICLLDFGIAKDTELEITNSTDDEECTQLGTVLGTIGYMSPEQATGLAINNRSDIYSLGCVMYFLLTGRHAFNSSSTIEEIIESPFPNINEVRSDLPEATRKIIEKATDRNMNRRYHSCDEFAKDIAKLKTAQEPEKIKLTIGRENCDIITPAEIKNISRHHCDIEPRKMTGGTGYRITNLSRNGTAVNGITIKEKEYVDIRPNENPTVYLSLNPEYRLDWNHIKKAIEAKGKGQDIPDTDTVISTGSDSEEPKATGRNQEPKEDHDHKYHKTMSFMEAVKSCFNKYAYFRGRASRAEYWYFILFNFLVMNGLAFLAGLTAAMMDDGLKFLLIFIILVIIYVIAVLLPGLAVSVRRLHDTDRSGVNYLWNFIPIVGGIVFLVFMLTGGTYGPNRYGPRP